MILGKITSLFGCDKRNIGTDKNMKKKKKRINGTVVLTKKNVLDFNDFHASIVDGVHEFLGKGVSLQLISLVHHRHTGNKVKEKLGKPAFLEWVNTLTSLTTEDSAFNVVFEDEVDEDENGSSRSTPGAFIIKNNHGNEFFLKTLTLHNVSAGQQGRVHFVCNSWVYPAHNYDYDRVFFSNKTYLPSEMPEPLRKYREQELVNLRGNGKGELKEWDRVYDYAYYNDLSDPDKGVKFVRQTLGGSTDFPYPRRGRTGRPPTKTDPKIESRMSLLDSVKVYVPRDERFGHLRMSDFLAYLLKALGQVIKPVLNTKFDKTPGEFDTFQDVLDIYEGGCPMPTGLIEDVRKNVPPQLLKEIFRTDSERFLKFPMPQVIQASRSAWRSDEEFAREMLAGVNPVVIRRLQEFPPASRLDPKVYGNQTSTITGAHIEHSIDGLTVDEALKSNKLFILDHHDTFMPYLRKINSTATKTYATRTLLFLQNDSTLKPLAIELSLPHPNGDKFGAVSKIYSPAKSGVQATIWELAKAYAAVNDSGFHQLVSHWLYTHAVMEPFVIAANRQLSVVHPIYKLLKPHFRDTMNINAQARQTLINAEGILESTVFPGKYAMEMSAVIYKNWVLTDQGLPQDLIKRGIAVKDPDSPHGLRLLIPDYPFAVDGLEIWSAIQTWVHEYTSHYYTTDEMVRTDPELQSWWTELREVGHGDKRSEPWWPRMQTRRDLAETCTVIIWITSALHAAVNFGQYPYAGYLPNRPTVSRRFMPDPNDPELRTHPERAFLRTITAEAPTLLGVSLIEILSRHASDEVYLGQREAPDWTDERRSLEAFERFRKRLVEIEEAIARRNGDEKLKNRAGPVKFPYTLLCPSSGPGITARGIPNSVSI